MDKNLLAQVKEWSKQKDPLVNTFQYTPSENHLKELRGSFFVFIRNRDEKEENFVVNKGLFESLKEKYYASSGSNLKALEECIDSFADQIGEIELVASVLWGSVLYIAKSGKVEIVLIREGQARKLDVAKTASGALHDKDRVLFLSSELSSQLDQAKLVGEKELEEQLEGKKASILEIKFSIEEEKELPTEVPVAQLGEKKLSQEENDDIDLAPVSKKSKFDQEKLKAQAAAGLLVLKTNLNKLVKFISPYAKILLEKILEPWKAREPGSPEKSKGRQRARIIQVAVVLILVLAISLGFGSLSRRGAESREQIEKTITEIKNKFESAESLKELNPALASEILSDVSSQLDTLPQNDDRTKDLRSTYASLASEINRIYEPEVKTIEDLTGERSGIKASDLVVNSSGIYVLDTGTLSVFKVSDGSSQILVSEKEGLENFSPSGDFLHLQTSDGIEKVNVKTSQEQDLKDASGNWKKIVSMASYRNNLYLLDSQARQIWKYTGEGLSGPSAWLSENLKADPVSFAIDGDIWVAFKNTVQRYSSGKNQNFELKNHPEGFNEIKDIATDEAQSNVYLLDAAKGAVFAFSKEIGGYVGLYKNNSLKGASALAVDEAKKTLYFLKGNTIFSFNIK